MSGKTFIAWLFLFVGGLVARGEGILSVEQCRTTLAGLAPSEAKVKEVDALILALGGDDYEGREAAARKLESLGIIASDRLKVAEESGDPEVALRARMVLGKVVAQPMPAGLWESLYSIKKGAHAGLAGEVIVLAPLCADATVLTLACDAMEATATEKDVEMLRAAAAKGPRVTRLLAVSGLTRVLPAGDAQTLAGLLGDGDEVVKLAAATAMAKRGDRRCFGGLAGLLESEDIRMRQGAVRILIALTGEKIAFAGWEPKASRERGVKAWRDWIAANGETAALKLPLKPRPLELGRTLLCTFSGKEVIEVDAAGKTLWKVDGYQYNWGCAGLSNGHRLVADQEAKKVFEYDENGDECWHADNLPGNPVSVERLENGRTLMAGSTGNSVYEVDVAGKLVWEVNVEGYPSCARRLENGNTLVTLRFGNKVVELDGKGKEVWSAGPFKGPYSAQRLENGNTVVCEMEGNRITEVDRAGNVVWKLETVSNPAEAQRLSNGNTLVGDEYGAREFDPQGNVVWRSEQKLRCRIHRF